MENQSISEASLKATITERLHAVHVDITDMSGWSIISITPLSSLSSSPVVSGLSTCS